MHAQYLSWRCLPILERSRHGQHVGTCLTSKRSFIATRGRSSFGIARYHTIKRLSNFWIPTGGIESARESQDDSHALLVRAGYLRQAHAGIFHMLPLGHRVQQKLEKMIDKHMESLGASKVSLSSLSSEDLWRKTGRFVGHGGELFALKDRKENKLLLAPTHEEEITSLVASAVQSYKDLPLRLYQITRKYRDEARPRQGLLRGREFTMKDLYTFDHTEQQARKTYEHVQAAYRAFLDELKLPYLVAKADSGNMGGNLSHEYHFVSSKGEDNVISCGECGNTINDELAMTPVKEADSRYQSEDLQLQHWFGVSKDRRTLVVAWFPRTTHRADGESSLNQVNLNVVKALVPDTDSSVEDALQVWDKVNPKGTNGVRPGAKVIEILDGRIPTATETMKQERSKLHIGSESHCDSQQIKAEIDGKLMQLTSTMSGDDCPSCATGKVTVDRAIEIGHTFHLGTRYSKPLDATVVDKDDRRVTVEMGCHGIGVTRLIGAIASMLADSKGLNWPASIAPFEAVIVPGKGNEDDAEKLYAALQSGTDEGLDAVVDDRNKAMGWKLNDADLVGYPLIVVLGRAWRKERKVEVQCRRLGVREEVNESELGATLARLLRQL